MPHKQKENHNHSSRSKKERLRAKQEQLARKKAAAEARALAEAEAALLKPNHVALAEGVGAYEIGCEADSDIPVRFNMKKRSKKHLRTDVRRNAERKEREEEEERLQREQEERLKQQQKEQQQESDEEEEPVVLEEYLVYICECCRKKYATTNQFANHANSKKHKDNAALYEEAGIIVTSVQLRGADADDEYEEYEYEEYDDDGEEECEYDKEDYYGAGRDDAQEESEAEEEEEQQQPTKVNLFSALAADDSSSSSDESSEDECGDEEDRKLRAASQAQLAQNSNKTEEERDEDEIDMLEEIINQNRLLLQNEIDAAENHSENEKATSTVAAIPAAPLPFDDEQYNPDHYTVNENRLASVHHRLQKRLAAKGIEPTRPIGSSDAVSVGKTLLQQLMEANRETLEAKLEAYNKHKAECQLLVRDFALARGNSKALPSQYRYKPGAADDTRKRANVHHTGSHYHMQASRSMQFGRSKGLLARHSSQGARLQAQRMASKELARVQAGGGGMKIGKTSKKSQRKRLAGGSKKTGGMPSDE